MQGGAQNGGHGGLLKPGWAPPLKGLRVLTAISTWWVFAATPEPSVSLPDPQEAEHVDLLTSPRLPGRPGFSGEALRGGLPSLFRFPALHGAGGGYTGAN